MIIAAIAMLLSFMILILLLYKKDAQKSTFISFLALAVCFYLLGNFLEISSTSLDAALVGLRVRYIGIPFIPTIWYLCVREFCGNKLENKITFFLLMLIPLFSVFLAFTWQDNHLLFSSVEYNNDENYGELAVIDGPLYQIRLVYQYAVNLLGIFTLIWHYRHGTRRFRKQALFFLISACIPIFNTATWVVPVSSHFVDVTPYALVITLALFSYALYRYGILNLTSIIKDNAINNLREGVILFDRDGVYMDSNHSAQHIFPQIKKVPLGTGIDEMDYLPFNFSLFGQNRKDTPTTKEFTKEHGGSIKVFNISVSQIAVKNKLIGYSIILNNISTLKKLLNDLREKSVTDALTNIYNRRYLYEAGRDEIENSRVTHDALTMIMFDLDRFKNINDNYGHSFGDYVLKSVAFVCSNNLRKSDIFARYGGEEFCILLVGTPLDIACTKAESLREKISTHVFEEGNVRINVTASFGVAEYQHGDSFDDLIKRTDDKLYEAKEGGRNRVSC